MLSMMRRVLEVDGYSVATADGGDAALDIVRSQPVDLLILDVMMPGLDGFEVCRTVRRESGVPILMLTARDEAVDKVTGLDCGADDYVVKPFNPDELMARVRALLRRLQPRQIEVLRFQDVEMVPSAREARRDGDLLELTAREYELLELFLRHPRQVLSREQILQDVWGFDYLGDSNLVDVRIKYLRDKLELGGRVRLIQTVRGAGYALRG
jgi:two-component system response regulator MprA